MVYALVEKTKELLGENETPEGDCCICADPLADGPHMHMRTQCYHAFHKNCFAHWHVQKASEAPPAVDHRTIQRDAPTATAAAAPTCSVPCPICRLPIEPDLVLPQVSAELAAAGAGSPWLEGSLGGVSVPAEVAAECLERAASMERQGALMKQIKHAEHLAQWEDPAPHEPPPPPPKKDAKEASRKDRRRGSNKKPPSSGPPAAAATAAAATAAAGGGGERWCYLDPEGVERGPFETAEMDEWFRGAFFADLPDMLVKLGGREFVVLSDLARSSEQPFAGWVQGQATQEEAAGRGERGKGKGKGRSRTAKAEGKGGSVAPGGHRDGASGACCGGGNKGKDNRGRPGKGGPKPKPKPAKGGQG